MIASQVFSVEAVRIVWLPQMILVVSFNSELFKRAKLLCLPPRKNAGKAMCAKQARRTNPIPDAMLRVMGGTPPLLVKITIDAQHRKFRVQSNCWLQLFPISWIFNDVPRPAINQKKKARLNTLHIQLTIDNGPFWVMLSHE